MQRLDCDEGPGIASANGFSKIKCFYKFSSPLCDVNWLSSPKTNVGLTCDDIATA